MWRILCFILFWPATYADVEEVVAVITQGKLVGVKLYTAVNNKPYFAFSTIPYAKPPVGNLRFKPPQDPTSWKGTRVLKFSPMCFQWLQVFDTSTFYGQEDCLYLNVFTPVLNENAKLPVIVCIHGGDFQRGSSYECPANNFMEKNVVFVSFNYRLGIFGFLSAGDTILPGNYGLKDQVAALKWIQKNIKTFGGDPDKVTIMGQGAGGASVHYHMYSPLSKGLFRAAISQSATALVPWAFTPLEVAKGRTFKLAHSMNCPNDTTGEIAMCLTKVQGKNLAELQPKLATWFTEPAVLFSPTAEPKDTKNPFLTKNPWKETELNMVPWIIGFNSGEGTFKASAYFGKNESLLKELNREMDTALPAILSYDLTAKKSDISAITKAIKKFYFKEKPVTGDSALGLIDFFTDSMASYGCMKAAARYNGKKYFYLFDHLNQNTWSNALAALPGLEKYKMPSLGDEMTSLLYVPWSYAKKDNIQNDLRVSNRMIEYWTNFVRLSNPNGESEEVTWTRMKTKFEYLRITTEKDEMGAELCKDRYSFWESLPLLSAIDGTSQIEKDEL